MRKKFAPLALLFGLLTTLMLASTSMAQATTPLPTLASCVNSGVVNVVTCSDVLHTVTVVIENNDVLSDNELTILKDALNNADIDIDILNITAAKNVVVNVYNNNIDPDITVGDVTICLASVCY